MTTIITAREVTPGMRVTGYVLADDTAVWMFGGLVTARKDLPATQGRGDRVWLNYRMGVPGDCWQAFRSGQRLTIDTEGAQR